MHPICYVDSRSETLVANAIKHTASGPCVWDSHPILPCHRKKAIGRKSAIESVPNTVFRC